MQQKTTTQLKVGDLIQLQAGRETLHFHILSTRPIHGQDVSRTRQRVTDIQVKLRAWPDGNTTPVFLFPVNKMWTWVRQEPVANDHS